MGLYRTTPAGRMLTPTRRWCASSAIRDLESLLETNVGDIYLDPEDRRRWQRRMERRRLGAELRGARCAASTARSIWVRFTVRAVRGEDGEILRYEGALEDVTDRRRAEEALRASEERFRSLVQHASDLISILTADGIVRYESPSHQRVLGLEPEAHTGAQPARPRPPGGPAGGRGGVAPAARPPGRAHHLRAPPAPSRRHLAGARIDRLEPPRPAGGRRHRAQLPRHHRPQAGGGEAPPRRPPRRADRAPQPGAVHGPAAPVDGALAPRAGTDDRRPLPRPRPLQDRQRQPRPPGGRRAADPDRRPRSPRRCAPRTPSPASAATSSPSCSKGGATSATPCGWPSASTSAWRRRSTSAATRSSPPPASASPSTPPSTSGPEDLLRDADTAMYRAKASGRACHVVFNRVMHRFVMARLQLETDLRRAVERGQMRVYYQPFVDLATGEVVGFEALLRWHHPRRGLLPPDEFLAVAEETGLIVPMGRFVLLEGCRQIRRAAAQAPGARRPQAERQPVEQAVLPVRPLRPHRGGPRGLGARSRLPRARDHRGGDHPPRRLGGQPLLAPEEPRACSSTSTISARATPRSTTSTASRWTS